MCVLTFLQQNAEWMCAIAIAYFAWKQYAITQLQIQQDLRMRRLELAQKLDEACKEFPQDKTSTDKLLEWCMSHQSEFIFLLQGKDGVPFARLMKLAIDLRQKYMANSSVVTESDVKQLYTLVEQLDYALGNASYGLTEIKQNKRQQ
ncbi:hypothetical protein [Candidatus Avelusimicrobium luingense]|uniref:hypothetical protein n=1 Tax=Candidatus Avelusimicrobium luingense TaxID=3416211 RepID=UPI003D0E9EC1